MSMTDDINKTNPPWNFSWVVKDKLAAFAWPQTLCNIRFLYENGIRHIVTLSPEKVPPVQQFPEMKWTLISIEEFEAPTLDDIIYFINLCEKCRENNEAVGVHCRMGRGRTGVMVACYLVKFSDLHPHRAVSNVRLQRPGSVETNAQERAVAAYYDLIMGLKVSSLAMKNITGAFVVILPKYPNLVSFG